MTDIGAAVRFAAEKGLSVAISEKDRHGSMHYGTRAFDIDWDGMDEESKNRLLGFLQFTTGGKLVTSSIRRAIFDWKKVCPNDIDPREFPAVVGPGRGVPLSNVRPRR